jgi:hypothetical protein
MSGFTMPNVLMLGPRPEKPATMGDEPALRPSCVPLKNTRAIDRECWAYSLSLAPSSAVTCTKPKGWSSTYSD